jgi:hypothetical protein
MTMTRKSVPPSIKETAFDCPHCGTYTTQTWYRCHAEELEKLNTPRIIREEDIKRIDHLKDVPAELKEEWKIHAVKLSSGEVFLDKHENSKYVNWSAENIFLSSCYNCSKIAVWDYDHLISPPVRQGAHPNADLPEDVLHDYEEARSILDLSPRGAAALLRLCVQKLCIRLGEKGRKIDDDIASLVKKGLNPLVHQSLDIVRVIGNEAVHPGVMDLKDDRDTATALFGLVNAIADQMITHPNTVKAMYEKLPAAKKAAIEKRDGKSTVEPSQE